MENVMKVAANNNFDIRRTAWDSFRDEGGSKVITKTGTDNFVNHAIEFFDSLPYGSEIYMIGHSFGSDSVLNLISRYNRNKVNFRLIAVLDAVGLGGFRSVTKNNYIQNHVEYFFNRWQTNLPFPNDIGSSGEVPCSAKTCDQQEQSISRHPDGSARMKECGWEEVTCEGYIPFKRRGVKQTRLHHQYVPTDPYIEKQIVDIINNLLGRAPDPSGLATLIDSSEGLTVKARLARPLPGGTLVLPVGDYPETLTINQRVHIESYGGPARIGAR